MWQKHYKKYIDCRTRVLPFCIPDEHILCDQLPYREFKNHDIHQLNADAKSKILPRSHKIFIVINVQLDIVTFKARDKNSFFLKDDILLEVAISQEQDAGRNVYASKANYKSRVYVFISERRTCSADCK